MAGDWIKMRIDLADDPAVISMAAKLGVEEFAVVGRLHKLWSWADRHSVDGHAVGVTQTWIDRHVACDGFAQAMMDAGWLSVDNSGLIFPNFDRHNGESAKKRGLSTERTRKARSVTQSATQMSRSQRDTSVYQRREEKSNSSEIVDNQQGDAAASARAVFEKPKQPGAAALAADAMRAAGLPGVSDTNPALVAAVNAGLTAAELAAAAADAVAKGKGFPWAIAAAEGRRRDAQAIGQQPLPAAAAIADPDSRASIEAAGERLGLGKWDQMREQWPQYRARVKAARGDAPTGYAANVLSMVMAGARAAA